MEEMDDDKLIDELLDYATAQDRFEALLAHAIARLLQRRKEEK